MQRIGILAEVAPNGGVRRVDRPRPLGAKTSASISRAADRRSSVTQPVGEVTGDFRLNAIGYLRVSTDEQAESGLGLEAQRASIKTAAARLGLTLRDVFVDAGVSGAKSMTARPVLVQAVTALQRGDVLLVAKRDRLGRDVFGLAIIERLVTKRGARVLSAAGEGTDDDDPMSVLMRRIIDAFAEYERLIIGARTKAALGVKRANGERIGTLPFGFQVGEDRTRLEPAPLEQDRLARILALRNEGRSTRQIAATLNSDGATTRRGGAWRFEYVARRLRKASA